MERETLGPAGEEKEVSAEEEKKEAKESPKTKKSLKEYLYFGQSSLISILGAVAIVYFVSWLFGHEGVAAPVQFLFWPEPNFTAILFFAGCLILYLAPKTSEFDALRAFTSIFLVIFFVHMVICGIWPNFSLKESLTSIGQRDDPVKSAFTTDEEFWNKAGYYLEKYGPPERVELSNEKWTTGPRIRELSKLHYLSSDHFWLRGRGQAKTKTKKSANEIHWLRFRQVPSDGTVLQFKSDNPGTVVYYWVEY